MDQFGIGRLTKTGFVFLIVLSIFFAVLTISAIRATTFIGSGGSNEHTITVSGEGEVFAVPDVAEFSFSVVEERNTPDAAQEIAADKVNRILSFLDENDVDDKDIKTTSYSVYPRYEYRREVINCVTFPCPQPPGERVLEGYEVRQSVRVKVRDTDAAGGLLAGVGELGAADISGLSFTIDDEDELQREARRLAIEDAQEKAKQLARDLDVKLVRVASFSEGGGNYYPRLAIEADKAFGIGGGGDVVPEIPVGENKIISNVTITYEIR